jgi:methylmalonyl-CoA/ethylmalonyl-CoA epimerase|tara:strand:- start:1116 stop:1517 length:402 start_codon:yes stop_codon:yes gene_type:complete
MKNIDHIGIAVKDIEKSNLLFEKLLNTPCYKIEEVKDQGVKTSFFKTEDQKIELIASLGEQSPIESFLEKKGEGLHHIAFEVANIKSEVERLKSEGFVPIDETPKKGADNKMVVFLHPKATNGVLIELCQEIK